MIAEKITVRSHVARDLLQSATLFKTDKLVVWEYVANGLQYRDHGVSPVVNVVLDPTHKQIIVDDNGSGMDQEGLRNFFIMHGENNERKAGRGGRGRFGTGKSAAFGIADQLLVSSIRNGRRNTVELARADILAAGNGEIVVRMKESDVQTNEPNGTVVTIGKLNIRRLDQRGVIMFIERHLAHWPDKPLVRVNNHVCEYSEPAVAESRMVRPSEEQSRLLGDVELTIKVAKSPLDAEAQGIAIHANGVWLESTLAGCQGQPMAQYIFGHIDVPALDDDISRIPAFDMSRSMKLNQNNEVVHHLLTFIGVEIDRIRRELVREEKAHRAREETKKLDREAHKIAEIINRDFQDFSDRLARVKANSGTGHDLGKPAGPAGQDDSQDMIPGGESNAVEDIRLGGSNGGGGGRGQGGPGGPTETRRTLRPNEHGKPEGQVTGVPGSFKRPRGGFAVEFKEMGIASARANYVSAQRTIYINLEHPQIVAARGEGNVDDPLFRRLAYEVAFTEYSIALATEMDNNGEFIEPSDALVEVRETLNRMARLAAALYAS